MLPTASLTRPRRGGEASKARSQWSQWTSPQFDHDQQHQSPTSLGPLNQCHLDSDLQCVPVYGKLLRLVAAATNRGVNMSGPARRFRNNSTK